MGLAASALRDLHTDDATARLQLRDELVAARFAAGLTRPEVGSELGITPVAVHAMETGDNWEIATIQRWGRAVGRQLRLEIVGLVLPDDGDVVDAVFAALQPATPQLADELAREVLVNDIIRLRRWRGWSPARMGAAQGVSDHAVRGFERCPPGVRLASCQRAVRALNGRLAIASEPLIDQAVTDRHG
ncbi:hypothetical protein [Micromonospora aurantiaca (nom. illeg.)]|uniref:hypothetical protein n=1 Tax=Micromonospora aurantiaca (nom. illeg.) TaxID=47850 RepID=UPI0033D62E3D